MLAPAVMKFFAAPLVVLATLLAACSEPTRFNSADISGVDWGKDFALTDHTGKLRHISDFKGQAVVLSFGYTQCPDVCPTMLTAMRDAMKLMGADAKRVQILFATLDPARDTPQLLAQYVPWFEPSFLGLWGDEAAIAAMAKDFKVFYAKQPGKDAASYSIDHSASSYIFDPQGRLRLTTRHGETPERIAADLRLLLTGK